MRRIACTLSALLLVGCASGTTVPDGWVRAPGRVEPALSFTQAVLVPPQVHAGVAFTVTVNTLGSSSCTRVARTEVDVGADTVAITPYNWEAPAGTGCTRDLRTFPHEARLQLSRRGEVLLRIHGRTLDGVPTMLEVPLVVQ